MLLGCFQIVRDSFLSGGAAKGSFHKGTLVFCLGIRSPQMLTLVCHQSSKYVRASKAFLGSRTHE
jgi:hypothetical protein